MITTFGTIHFEASVPLFEEVAASLDVHHRIDDDFWKIIKMSFVTNTTEGVFKIKQRKD